MSLNAQMWAECFNDIPFNVVLYAVQAHLLKSQFAPSIAEIRLRCMEMTKAEKPKTAQEAWEDVTKAIKRFGYYQQDKAFDTLEERTKRAVRVIGWQNICHSENVGIERANFIKFYDSYSADTQDKYIFPKALTDKISQIMLEQKQNLLEDKGNEQA